MKPAVVTTWGGEAVELRAERAALLVQHRTLLVADVHLGKARAFRQQGVPVPGGTTRETLSRLTALVAASRAEHIVFLGDLLHSRHAQASSALDEFARWRAAHAALSLTLVRGNHDRHAGDPPDALRIARVEEPFALGGLALCHHPQTTSLGRPRVAGHVHPCYSVVGRSDRLRLPCFHFSGEVALLPAFGAFTGMHGVQRKPDDRLWVIADDEVVALPAR